MRSLRVLVVVAVAGSLTVGAAAAPAQAVEGCAGAYLAAVSALPAPPEPGDVVTDTGSTLIVNARAVIDYADTVMFSLIDATTAYSNCAIAEAQTAAWDFAVCLAGSPAVAHVLYGPPDRTARYVQVDQGVVYVHYGNAIADAVAFAGCVG